MRQEIINALEELKTVLQTKKGNPSFLSIESYECKLNNGKTITREKILKKNNNGGAAIIYSITEDGKIILAVEPRVFTTKTVDIGFPAGYIEKDENPIDAAKRELKEETGYSTKNIKKLTSFYPSTAFSNEELIIYIAKDLMAATDLILNGNLNP